MTQSQIHLAIVEKGEGERDFETLFILIVTASLLVDRNIMAQVLRAPDAHCA
jgi:hypothetical protein